MIQNRFRAPFSTLVRATLFVGASAAVVALSIVGYSQAGHTTRMVLGMAGLYPALMFVVALLRFAVIASRSIDIYPDRLVHRQLFKNSEVHFDRIRRIEALTSAHGGIETIRISHSGMALQVEAKAFEAFEELFSTLRQRVKEAPIVRVEEFESAGT